MFTFVAYLYAAKMRYNTEEKRLALPDYGRNIQNIVDYCTQIEDREERNRCAAAIINIMGNMFPHLRDVSDFKHILWDHLAVMSDFKLDVDYPYEVLKKEDLYKRPPRLEYSNSRIAYRHYGKIMERMIAKATELENGDEKAQLIRLLANHMKKSFMTWNKDSVDDRKILKDLDELSEGQIVLNEDSFRLTTEGKDGRSSNYKKPFVRKGSR
jgi:hypothetical protein